MNLCRPSETYFDWTSVDTCSNRCTDLCVHELINLVDQGFLKIKKRTQGPLLPLRNSIPTAFHRNKDRVRKERQWSSSLTKSAKELKEAGVKFMVKRESSFLDVSFKSGVMEFPIIHIYENTMALFRNLMAFEQCYPYTKDHITYYAGFMDCLINTPTDVKVLQGEGILRIGISSEKEIAQFFNTLCREVYFDDLGYLQDLISDVNRYCDSKIHKWWAVLARKYFNSPWAVISLIAAFIILVLTLLQTVYTIYGYCQP